jgi:hypothetical protein
MPEPTFASFLAESFALLRREADDVHGTLCRRLEGRTVAIRVDGEAVAVRFDAIRADVLGSHPSAEIEVSTTRAAILDVLAGDLNLLDAVLADRLVLRGAPAALLAFHDGLLLYVHGAVRAPSFPSLLRRFRATSARSSHRRA